ncbi:MAG: D-glycero-beta-D-manno-heptose 1-phosphate adenylyltransferase [Rhodospirillales bacterium]|nr:D-glycero-beta-D-manno-heptose 1-phosphate adenylyltransferase [Rhodospirillales bacterium]MSP80059.1 D-glycero-beta-D-manno-heptose 1-phosphate adenylyltransferase [Rhodospirillales bacterium]
MSSARVAVAGDVMLDIYVAGTVERISPEAPIPVLRVERETAMPGGAGNVARNVAALGAAVRLTAAVGADDAARRLDDLIAAEARMTATLVADPTRKTAIKTRYVGGNQQMLRTDRETVGPLSADARKRLIAGVKTALADCAVLVLSDYGKGALADGVAAELIAAAKQMKRTVIVDPKGRDWSPYAGADVVKPNRRELALASGAEIAGNDTVVAAARTLIARQGLGAVLATLGPDGMILVRADGKHKHFRAEAREVFDVSGAGDTAVAVLAVLLATGAALADAVLIANVAAGIVVGKAGAAVVAGDELAHALHRQDLKDAEAKVLTLGQALARVRAWRGAKFKVGFTNGCFDLLHPGHVSLLAQARAACDKLIVGLNSDASVTRLKGAGRPVQPEAARSAVLASLAAVDAVVVFAEDTPLTLIEAIRPDLLVKGADYAKDKVVGGALVEQWGGKVLLAEIAPGHSTSATIAKLAR